MAQVSSRVRPMTLAWLEQAGERRYVESETRIGRGEQNDIRLAHASVSRDHAVIRRVDGVYVISDLDSANGTFVNDQRVNAPRPLSTGDRIRLAEVAFTFNVDAPESPADTGTQAPVSTSISQFLTMSGRLDVQNYLQGELRVVSVLFLDLCGFTALSENMSPEQVTLVVNQCFQHLTETAIRFGGFVDKYIGDAMMVLFGAPNAHEDDAERAVRAAIAMQDDLVGYSERLARRSGITLQMRVGINTGEVLAGEIGSGQFSAFTVMGDTVNLASRLEARARIGHILVNETTYELTKHRIQYSALPPTQIRGKNEPVVAYEVLGALPDIETPSDVSGLAYVLDSPQLTAEDVRPLLQLRSAVQAQLDAFDNGERNVLRVASLIGRPWTAQLVGFALAAPAGLEQTLGHLVDVGLLTQSAGSGEAEYAIRAEAIRAVIDASLPEVERRRLHERIALGLQREYDPTKPDPVGLKRIARHFARAGKHWQAVEYLLRSADLGVVAASAEVAVEGYRLVLAEAEQVADKKERTRLTVELQERIGDALLKDGSLAEAQIAFETAASAASPEREAELHLKLALTGVRRGNPRRVLEITRIVLEQVDMTDSSRATAEALTALSLASQGVVPEALERTERSLRLASDAADPGAVGLAHFAAGRAQFMSGQLTLARDQLQLSIAAHLSAPDQAAASEAQLQLGRVLCELGELDEAEACVRQAIVAGRAADRWNRACAGLVLGRLFEIRGEASRGKRHVQEALVSAESAGARELALELSIELASAGETGLEELRSLVDTALARQLEPVACLARIQLARALSAHGGVGDSSNTSVREALKIAHAAALRARAKGLELHEALARRVLAQLLAETGHWPHAVREFEAAAAIQERQAAAVELVRTLVAASDAESVYAASPRLDHIRQQLDRARRMAGRIGIKRESEEATRLLTALHD